MTRYFAIFLSILTPFCAYSATITVDVDVNAPADFVNIQDAIYSASPGDTILVIQITLEAAGIVAMKDALRRWLL